VEGFGCVWLYAFMMAAPTRCSPVLRLERLISQLVGGGGDDDGGLAVKVDSNFVVAGGRGGDLAG
jgi:hypothetical protein